MPHGDNGNDDIVRRLFEAPSPRVAACGKLRTALEDLELKLILEALESFHGNMAAAAYSLGITERIMGLRVRKYGIDPHAFRLSRSR